jgi:transcriptional regulator with XRE-family HTH domain
MQIESVAWVRRLGKNGGARAIREGAGFSVSEIARELGVSPSAVSRWERGERSPGTDLAGKWAHILRKLAA